MKKGFIAILAVIYLVVSSGVTMNVHYCMGKLASIDLYHKEAKCGKCGMEKTADGCCTDEYKVVKLDDSHKLVNNEINFFSPVALFANFSIFRSGLPTTNVVSGISSHSPPDSPLPSLNILHCVFRI